MRVYPCLAARLAHAVATEVAVCPTYVPLRALTSQSVKHISQPFIKGFLERSPSRLRTTTAVIKARRHAALSASPWVCYYLA